MAWSRADWVRGLARLISSAMRSWAKTGPFTKRKERRPVGALVEDFGAQDVGGHQVRRELDAAGVEAEHGAQRLHELRLGEAGDADEKAVAAGEKGDEGQVDDVFLAEDDRVDGLPGAPDSLKGRLRTTDDRVVQGGRRLSNAGRHEVILPLIPNSPE